MKVRLKLYKSSFWNISITMFQFHEGPIKAVPQTNGILYFFMFQFHEGPIKATTK